MKASYQRQYAALLALCLFFGWRTGRPPFRRNHKGQMSFAQPLYPGWSSGPALDPLPPNLSSWSAILSAPGATVSPYGISTGATVWNDGATFGPDTAGTKTSGIQEALNATQHVILLPGPFLLTTTLKLPSTPFLFEGSTFGSSPTNSVQIAATSALGANDLIAWATPGTANVAFVIQRLQLADAGNACKNLLNLAFTSDTATTGCVVSQVFATITALSGYGLVFDNCDGLAVRDCTVGGTAGGTLGGLSFQVSSGEAVLDNVYVYTGTSRIKALYAELKGFVFNAPVTLTAASSYNAVFHLSTPSMGPVNNTVFTNGGTQAVNVIVDGGLLYGRGSNPVFGGSNPINLWARGTTFLSYDASACSTNGSTGGTTFDLGGCQYLNGIVDSSQFSLPVTKELKAQTGNVNPVLQVTPGAEVFLEVSGYLYCSAYTSGSQKITISWQDPDAGNQSETLVGVVTGSTTLVNTLGAVGILVFFPITLRVKAGTQITLQTNGGGSLTYDVGVTVKKVGT